MKRRILFVIGFTVAMASISMAAEIDLFKPFIKLKRETPNNKSALLPIQRLQLSEISLKGIIWVPKRPLALVEDTTGKGYILKVGDPIGPSGYVKEIKRDRIVIEEKHTNILGEQKTKTVELTLPKKEEEGVWP